MPWKYGRSIYCAKNSQVHLRGNVIKGTIIREMSFRYVKTAVDLWGSAGVLRAQAWASPGSGLPRRALGPSSSWSSWCSYCCGFAGNLATGGVRWSFLVVRTSLYQKPESLKVLSVNKILGLDVSKKVYVLMSILRLTMKLYLWAQRGVWLLKLSTVTNTSGTLVVICMFS